MTTTPPPGASPDPGNPYAVPSGPPSNGPSASGAFSYGPLSGPSSYGPFFGPPLRRRGKVPIILGVIAILIAAALFVSGVVEITARSVNRAADFPRVALTSSGNETVGTGAVTFTKLGDYVAYYEAPGADAEGVITPEVRVSLTSPSGHTSVLTTLYGGRTDNKIRRLVYSVDGHHGHALYQFAITETGTYRVAMVYGEPLPSTADMAFGKSILGSTVIGALLIVAGILVGALGLLLLIIGLVLRARSPKAPPGGFGPSPYPY